MADDKVLSAAIRARESVTGTLGDIEDAAEDTADAFDSASASGDILAATLDVLESNADALSRSLDSLPDSAFGASAGLSAVEETADETGDAFAAATPPTNIYGNALSGLSTDAIASIAPQYAAADAADSVGDEAAESAGEVTALSAALTGLEAAPDDPFGGFVFPDVDDRSAGLLGGFEFDDRTVEATTVTDTDVERPDRGRVRSALDAIVPTSVGPLSIGTQVEDVARPSIPDTPDFSRPTIPRPSMPDTSDIGGGRLAGVFDGLGLGGLGGGAADMDIGADEARERIDSIRASILSLPDLTIGADIEGTAELVATLRESRTEALQLSQRLGDLDVDIEGISSVGVLTARLDEGNETAQELAAELRGLSGPTRDFMNDALAASGSAELLEERIEETGDSAIQTAVEMEALDSATGGAVTETVAATGSFYGAASALDEYSDEAEEATAQTGLLSAVMTAAGGSADGLGARVGPLSGSLGTVLAVTALLLPVIMGLGAGFGALAVAALGAGGALATLFGAGLLAQGEALVGTTQEIGGELTQIESAGQGVAAIFDNLKDQAAAILAPLQTPETAAFAQGFLDAGLETFADFVTMVSEVMGPVFDMTDRLGEAWAIEQPQFFAELEGLILDVLPYLESFLLFLIHGIPDALAFFREEGTDLLPMLADLSASLADAAPELAELGITLLSVAIPALALLIDVLLPVIEAFNALPDPVKQGASALLLTAGAALALVGPVLSVVKSAKALYVGAKLVGGALGGWATASSVASAALSGLTTVGAGLLSVLSTVASVIVTGVISALTALAGIVGWPVIVIGALIAVIAGVITYFGWWDDIMRAITGTIDWIVGGIQGMLLWLAGLFGQKQAMRGFFSGVTYWLDRVAGALRAVGEAYDTAAGFFDHMVGSTDEWVGRQFDDTKGSGPPDESGGSGSGGGGGGGGGDGQPPAPPGPQPPPAPPAPPAGAAGGAATAATYQDNRVSVAVDARGSSMNARYAESLVERVITNRTTRNRKRNYVQT